MSRAPAFEAIPKTAPNPPPPVTIRPMSAAARRRRLRRVRRAIQAFEPDNRYQAWWHIVGYYSHALRWPEMAGPRARKVLKRLLEQDQVPPSKLWKKGVDHEKSLQQARPFHR